MAVYDCCIFWMENDLFEIRLNQHWNFVDKFIVVEAGETHTGTKKPFNFDNERFKPWASKIVYQKFDSFEEEMSRHPELIDSSTLSDRNSSSNISFRHSEDWARDSFQTNYLLKVLRDCNAQPNDIVHISCCDEITKQSAFDTCKAILESSTEVPIFMFRYWLYAYKFNLLSKNWMESDTSGLMSLFSTFDKTLPGTLREHRICSHIINDAGWHFTFMDNTGGHQVLAKHKSWAHSRDEIPGEKRKYDYDESTIHEAVEHVIKGYNVSLVELSPETHPDYLLRNIEKFKDFLL